MDPGSRRRDAELQSVRALGRQIVVETAGTESEIDAAFAGMVQAGAGALFIGPSPLYNSRRRQLAVMAARYALPSSSSLREFVLAGGLMSYSARDTDAYRRGALYVGRILKGEKPGGMPWSCRPNTNWSSTSRPPRLSGSTCRLLYSPLPTK